MSPEQCRGASDVEQRSDVYALGCVLFTLVTGHLPFGGDEAGDVMAMHVNAPPPVPSRHALGIPAAIDRLVLRCMAKDPARRFTACELASTIDALLQAPSFTRSHRRTRAPSSDVAAMDALPTIPAAPVAPDRGDLRLAVP